MKPASPMPAEEWRARLSLGFEYRAGCTRLTRRGHEGPLVLQRPFYPEGPAVCQGVVVHPPGGIAGGDTLEIEISVGAEAHAQLTTPGAGKWYRGYERASSQRIRIAVDRAGVCEWLPQENIVFDGAHAAMHLEVDLCEGAVYCGWELTCLGRPESDAPFRSGSVRQSVAVRKSGRTLFRERACLEPGAPALAASTGLEGHCAYGTLIVAGSTPDRAVIERAREAVEGIPMSGVTAMGEVFVARWVGDRVEQGRSLFTSLWAILRPWYVRRMALVPRIWAT